MLLDLGKKIQSALSSLGKDKLTDQKEVKKCVGSISLSLLKADVDIKFVQKMKNNILQKYDTFKGTGVNIAKIIKNQVLHELIEMLSV